MTTTERPGRRFGPAAPPAGPKVADHPGVLLVHMFLAWVLLPLVVGPGMVAGLAHIDLSGTADISGTAFVLLLVGFAVGFALGIAVGPRKRLFPARPASNSRTSRRSAR